MERVIDLGDLIIPLIKPQKGVDYYTASEKQEFVNIVTNNVNEVVLPQEEIRQSNEVIRQDNEATRQSQEDTRQSNETSRQTAETARASAESTRQSNETSRVSAEETRAQTFSSQMNAVDTAIAGINTSQTAFNENATSKTSDFNTNATNKTTAFNENATSKTNAFDEHTAEIQAKLATIETGAQVNIIESVKVNGTVLTPTDKEVDVPVPTKTSDLTNDSGFGTYSKPSGGIPKTDLSSDVQTSLGKADTALQEHQDIRAMNTNFINYPINLFDKNSVLTGQIAGSDINTTQPQSNFNVSNVIEVEEGSTYCFSVVPNSSDKRMMFYDKSGNSLGNTWITESTTNPTIKAPNNAWYCRFNIKKADNINTDTFMFVKGTTLPANYISYKQPELSDKIKLPIDGLAYNVLKGKKLGAVGDSITYGYAIDVDEDTGIRMTYAGITAYNNGMEYVNYGVSGSTMISNGPNGFSNTRYQNMATDLDYITIWFGWNDCGLIASETNQLGNIDSTDTTTFYGAWNTVMSYLVNNYRKAKIGLIVPYVSITHDQQELGASIRKAVRDIAQKYGVTCLDLYSDNVPLFYNREPSSNVNSTASKRKRDMFLADGCHPNENGYDFLATIYENFLRSL